MELAVLVLTLNLEIAILFLYLSGRIREKSDLILLAVFLAFFHCFAATAGFYIGNILNSNFGESARYISAIILILVGLRITIKSAKNTYKSISQSSVYLILLGAGIEDFVGGMSVGVGAFGGSLVLLNILFFSISIPFNILAYKICKNIMRKIRFSADTVTGILLIGIGILSIFDVI